MPRRRPGRFSRFLRDRSNRFPLVAFAVATLLLLLSTANLVVAGLDRIAVSGDDDVVEAWTMGRDGTGPDAGSIDWSFTVDPGTNRVVDLDLSLPYRMTADHVEGNAILTMRLGVEVDGGELGNVSHQTTLGARDAGETRTVRMDLGHELGRIVVERDPDGGPFEVVLNLVWNMFQSPEDATRFDVRLGPAGVEPYRFTVIPGCDVDCARVVFIGALVLQGVAVVAVLQRWHRTKPRPPQPARPGDRPGPPRGTDKKK